MSLMFLVRTVTQLQRNTGLVEAVAIAIVKVQSSAAEGYLLLAEYFETNFAKQDNNIRKWACEQENV
ncbi:hypothetical protein T4E_4512 [Trichinella pseudospiralis]|uniref:Uncharacterized protein n=1 Tax=Trichinella pseudospiralis TaxID=6337 RepID=A0A0V0YGZ7_TRIPS|nr:hypothetical protein T4E_4512 [Trichinella pseudospiralis]